MSGIENIVMHRKKQSNVQGIYMCVIIITIGYRMSSAKEIQPFSSVFKANDHPDVEAGSLLEGRSISCKDALMDSCVAERITSGRLLSGSLTGLSALSSSSINGEEGRTSTMLSQS